MLSFSSGVIAACGLFMPQASSIALRSSSSSLLVLVVTSFNVAVNLLLARWAVDRDMMLMPVEAAARRFCTAEEAPAARRKASTIADD